MSSTLGINYMTSPAWASSAGSSTRRTASQGSDFLSMASKLQIGASAAMMDTSKLNMEAYKKTIQEQISQMPLSSTRQMESISIHISDAAFERMKTDPEYEAWVLNDLREAFSQTNPWVPVCGGGYSVFYIGETKEECHAESWYPGYQDGNGEDIFEEKSSDSFWERRMESHKKFMELQAEAAARRRIFIKLLQNGGTLSTSELLFDLL